MKKTNKILIIVLTIIVIGVIVSIILTNSGNEHNELNNNLLNSNNSNTIIENNDDNTLDQINNKSNSSTNDFTKDYTFIQKIIINDENSSTTIVKNKLLKTAVIEIDFFVNTDEMITDFMDMRDLMTDMVCSMSQLSFFDPEGLEELNKQIEEWNNSEYVISDDSPDDQKEETFSEDILEGYNISKVHLRIINENKETISECIITGKDEKDIEIKKYYE